MKQLLKKTFEAIIILITIFLLGILIPTITSLYIVIFNNDVTMTMCTNSEIFWISTIIGWCIALLYINTCLKIRGY